MTPKLKYYYINKKSHTCTSCTIVTTTVLSVTIFIELKMTNSKSQNPFPIPILCPKNNTFFFLILRLQQTK